MRVIEIKSFGGPEVLHLVERPIPEAAGSKILIRVMAV